MKIILKQDMDDLGMEGEVVEVAKGFARNYLIPRGFGLEATPQNAKALEALRKKVEVRRLKAKEEAEQLKQKMQDIVVTLAGKVGEEGKLYGSITGIDIASELEKKGVVVDRRKIVLEKPIKSIGEYQVPIKIYPKVTATIKVEVVSEEE